MKKLFFFAILAMIFTACSSDNDKATVADIAGVYSGYTLTDCAYFKEKCAEGESVTVTKASDNTANVTFKSQMWGEFTINNAQMTEADGTYTLSGTGITVMGMQGKTAEYECQFSAVIKSLTDAKMVFSVPTVMGGTTVKFYTGKAPSK